MMSGYRDNSTGSSSHNTMQYRQWRHMNLLSDFSSVCPTQPQNQQQSCFSALLPPPPLPTASKILPPTSSNMSISAQFRSKSQVQIQEILPPFEEHQKDEECLDGKSDIIKKPIEKDPKSNSSSLFGPNPTYRPLELSNTGRLNVPLPDHSIQQTQIRSRPSRSPSSSSATAIPLPRILNTGGFHSHSIAPAVQIQSVIPVCAAPPMRPPTPNPQTPLMKETSPSLSALASVSSQPSQKG
ncbi:hypothetical protein HHK36_014628 [Tetracentron sinense]|uniref:Uncharacterized protein n=1 Tax=Tetracentron sinense TaxID=13715 RepID=A0A834Z389_TETSI|nr:hypothetical protein HHK36_014628 [Tetracentron sinense]